MSTFGKANKQRNNVYFEETEDFAAVTAQVLGGTKEVNAKYARHIADSCNEITTLREQVEKLTAALKLSREALSDAMEWCICRDSNFYKPCEEALAAIDALKGE